MKKILFVILIASTACTASKNVTEKNNEKPTEKITVEITEDDNFNFCKNRIYNILHCF